MFKFQFILIICLFCYNSQSQVALKSQLHNVSNADCDYKISLQTLNLPAGGQLVRKKYDNNLSQFVFTNINQEDTLTDFCFGEQLEYQMDGYAIASYGGTLPNRQNHSYEIINYQAPSNYFANDGSLTIRLQTEPMYISGGTDGSGFAAYGDEIDSLTYLFDSLVTGAFRIETIYSEDVVISGFFKIFIGDPSVIFSENSFDVEYEVFDDTLNSCVGSIQLTPINAVGNVTYTWDNNAMVTGNFQDNLCPGIYSILATDENMNSALVYIPIMDSNSIFVDSSYYFDSPADTVFFNFLNCELDYNLDIDSVSYNEELIYEDEFSSLFAFYLIIYQDTNSFVFYDTLEINHQGLVFDYPVLLSFSIYCDIFKTIERGKRILMIQKTENINQEVSLIEKSSKTKMILFPNPTHDLLEINGLTNYELVIYDINGRSIQQFNSKLISLENFDPGIYFIRSKEVNESQKIIKF